jgi:hypothetical protein
MHTAQVPFNADYDWACGAGAFNSTWWVPLRFLTGKGPPGTQWAILDGCAPSAAPLPAAFSSACMHALQLLFPVASVQGWCPSACRHVLQCPSLHRILAKPGL